MVRLSLPLPIKKLSFLSLGIKMLLHLKAWADSRHFLNMETNGQGTPSCWAMSHATGTGTSSGGLVQWT